jgi:hypothetical protein
MQGQGEKPVPNENDRSAGACGPDCVFCLGESQKLSGVGLCCNSTFILENESCFKSMGIVCPYFRARDADEEQGILIIGEGKSHPGAESRRHPREDVFVAATIKTREDLFKDFPGAVIDISESGMAMIFGRRDYTRMKQVHGIQRFDVTIRINENQEINLACECRRIEEHKNFVQLSVYFLNPLNKEMKKKLKMKAGQDID